MSSFYFYDDKLSLIVSENFLQKPDENKIDFFNDDEIAIAFSKVLKEFRKHTGETLMELSRKTGIPNQTLSAYENCTRVPSFVQALKLTAYYGCTVEEFIATGLELSFSLDIYERWDIMHNSDE